MGLRPAEIRLPVALLNGENGNEHNAHTAKPMYYKVCRNHAAAPHFGELGYSCSLAAFILRQHGVIAGNRLNLHGGKSLEITLELAQICPRKPVANQLTPINRKSPNAGVEACSICTAFIKFAARNICTAFLCIAQI